MKRINLIFVSNNEEPIAQEDVESSVSFLQSAMQDFPGLKSDEELVKVIASVESQQEPIQQQQAQQQQQQQAAENGGAADGGGKEKQDENGGAGDASLNQIPFFSENSDQLEKVDESTLKSFAESIGIKTDGNWAKELASKAITSKDTETKLQQISNEYDTVKQSIASLPKEIQMAISAVAEGKDWRTVIGSAQQIDYSADYEKLPNEKKIAIHNYYFPEDKLDATADLSEKSIAKSMKAAQAAYSADKYKFDEVQKKAQDDNKAKREAFVQSIDASIQNVKQQYPNFNKTKLAEAEEIIRVKGIGSIFFDENGNLTKEGAERVLFALHGKDILNVAVAVAKNRGKSDGKAEVLQTEQSAGGGGGGRQVTRLTNEEEAVKTLYESSVDNLTY